MLSISEALRDQAQSALTKAESLRAPGRFTLAGLFGGAYVGIGAVLMVSAAGPLVAEGDPLAKFIGGLVFGVALTIVVFAGAELVTSTMMTAVQGRATGAIGGGVTTWLITVTFVLNFVGAALFSALIVASGVLASNESAAAMLTGLLNLKAGLSPLELFVRGVLCNTLVCLAVWMGVRIQAPGARIAAILLAMLAFVASGFEHVVANMTMYWIGAFTGVPAAAAPFFAGNMLFVGLGNLVGGAVCVGLAYWYLGGSPRFTPASLDSVRSPATHTPR